MAPSAKLVTTLLVTQLVSSYGFTRSTPSLSRTRVIPAMSSLGGLAKKMKEKDLAPLREQAADPTSAVAQAMQARGSRELTDELYTALKKPKRCISCVAEFRRKGKLQGVLNEVNPPIILSTTFRKAGAHAVSVLLDSATGGATAEDVEIFRDEQETQRGNFPGPLPLIVHDVVIDEVQLALAASLDAKGVYLSVQMLGDELGAMVQAAREYGLEPIVHTRNANEIKAAAAVEPQPRIMSLSGMSVDDMIEAVGEFPDEVIKQAFLPLYDDEQLIEAEDAWRLRDSGYNSVLASELLYKFGDEAMGDNTASIIKAISAKGSVKYTRASMAFVGKGEGAREYLGYLEM